MRTLIAAVLIGLGVVGSAKACNPQNLVLQQNAAYVQPVIAQPVQFVQAHPVVYSQNVVLQQNALAVQQKGRQLNVQSAGGLNNLRIRQRGLFGRKLDIRAN